ncbi:hypothetical protein JTE90_014310 [Oedothorax gibbosus]|uniref:Uncharacterized protein n=1 Tax=Oedothorax gibbosus TaxID=931172 RepID=A0AAV6UXK1_9ARAC|nr:hypothetical protein JTE90_014310 [Oedothorax gibbosus]
MTLIQTTTLIKTITPPFPYKKNHPPTSTPTVPPQITQNHPSKNPPRNPHRLLRFSLGIGNNGASPASLVSWLRGAHLVTRLSPVAMATRIQLGEGCRGWRR